MHDPLEELGARQALAAEILKDIDNYCIESMGGGHRHHLGASLIGDECSRKLWYIFRWVHTEEFSGQQLRLFDRGHLEEFRFVKLLRGIGAQVREFQEDGKTQFRISGVNGHFGGALDGQLLLPTKYGDLSIFLAEFKTSNDKGFKEMKKKKSVAVAKPEHFSQMSSYGAAYEFKYALYMMVNKDNDDLYIEIVKLDWMLGADCARKAMDVIRSSVPLPKMSQDPTYYKCKWCHFQAICHYGAPIEQNCRSCSQATAVENGQWHCSLYNQVIPKDALAAGCGAHTPIV